MERDYFIVSAVRNEAEFLEQTLQSVISQTLLPIKWVIVDDGSTDGTGLLAKRFSERYSWIEVVARPDRGFRQAGVGVAEAFYDGFSRGRLLPWNYVVKLDGDVLLPRSYFEQLMAEFEKDPRLGICSGAIYKLENGILTLDSPNDPEFHVRGAAKMYRRTCWEAIGGIPRVTGFDCVDNLKARMLGWDTRCISSLKVIHLRPTGQANGPWRNGLKDGLGANAIGYHPIFLVLKCLRRFVRRGTRINALGQLCGFVMGYFADMPRVQDRALIRYVRRQQLNRLLGRKTIWR